MYEASWIGCGLDASAIRSKRPSRSARAANPCCAHSASAKATATFVAPCATEEKQATRTRSRRAILIAVLCVLGIVGGLFMFVRADANRLDQELAESQRRYCTDEARTIAFVARLMRDGSAQQARYFA